MGGILYAIAAVLVVLWILGFALHVAAGFIHLLLVLAVILVVWNLVMGQRSTV